MYILYIQQTYFVGCFNLLSGSADIVEVEIKYHPQGRIDILIGNNGNEWVKPDIPLALFNYYTIINWQTSIKSLGQQHRVCSSPVMAIIYSTAFYTLQYNTSASQTK